MTQTGQIEEFDTILQNAAISVLHKSDTEAAAFVQRNCNTYWRRINEAIGKDKQSGRTPLFRIVDQISRRVISPNPSHLCTHRSIYLQAVDRLTDREYEALPCFLIKLAGGMHVQLTPAGNEWGVDFFALIRNPSRLHIFDGSSSPIRLVGQCKKYNSRITLSHVKEFSRTLEALRNRKPEIEKHVPIWFRANSGPIIPWIICHSAAQSGAYELAKDEGTIISDSIDISESLHLLYERVQFSTHGATTFLQTGCNSLLGL